MGALRKPRNHAGWRPGQLEAWHNEACHGSHGLRGDDFETENITGWCKVGYTSGPPRRLNSYYTQLDSLAKAANNLIYMSWLAAHG